MYKKCCVGSCVADGLHGLNDVTVTCVLCDIISIMIIKTLVHADTHTDKHMHFQTLAHFLTHVNTHTQCVNVDEKSVSMFFMISVTVVIIKHIG